MTPPHLDAARVCPGDGTSVALACDGPALGERADGGQIQNLGLAKPPGRETGPTGRRRRRRPPLEGSLVSDTTEFLTSSHDTVPPADAPAGVSRGPGGVAAPDAANASSAGPGGVASAAAPVLAASDGRSRRGGGGLASKLLPELQQMAQSMGIKGTGRMRKGELI